MTGRAGVSTGALALVLASVLWGTTGTAASFLPDAVSPLAIGASTMVGGALLLFLVSARGALAAIRHPVARRWLLIGAVGVFVYPLAFYSAMDEAGVAIGNVVALGSGPVFAALFEWVWEKRGLSGRWLVSTTIAIAGIVLLSFGGHGGAGSGNVFVGVLLGLLAGLAYALYTYASSRAIGTGHASRSIMGGMFGLGAIALLPVLLLTGGPLLDSLSTVGIASYLAVGPMFFAYLLFGFGLVNLRSSVVTTITLIEPLVATLLAVLIVGERLDVLGWVGLALIFVGVTVIVSARQPRNPPVEL
ncbi:EamA family transporter [Glaciihabitans arcticus]|uniref:EamA family transporter n=1 Tax=Glaciihabitans arcticus TaxID=2668039 RepID=A0A4Q9GPX7_9MICO|nr:EamA family transporter [Glaciihabitans arcticus]TBN56876.1 EamA family transporter [Glaciihabitans arcticus]